MCRDHYRAGAATEQELPQRRPCPNLSVEFLAQVHQGHISNKISSLHVFAQQGDVLISPGKNRPMLRTGWKEIDHQLCREADDWLEVYILDIVP
jgi:hypothetical protein